MQTTAGTPDPKALVKRAEELATDGKIDPLAGLVDDNVYLFSGNEDQTVTRPVVEVAAEFLKDAGVAASNLTLVEKEGGHAFITEQGGAACGITRTPFVSDCDYDQAKAILAWIYGPLTPAEGPPKGRFILFDQQPFSEPGDGFADEGVIYVPPSCTEKPGCISRCMAASNRVRLWATTSSRSRATPRSPTQIGLSSSSRKRRQSQGSTPKAAGIGGAIRASTISARTRPRSQRFGPWSSISPRGLDGHARGPRDVPLYVPGVCASYREYMLIA